LNPFTQEAEAPVLREDNGNVKKKSSLNFVAETQFEDW
jgi:hypothetical protein